MSDALVAPPERVGAMKVAGLWRNESLTGSLERWARERPDTVATIDGETRYTWRALALELGPQDITVNGVSPGVVDTDSSRLYVERGLGVRYEDAVARLVPATPLRRLGTVEDVASLVVFLASEAAGFITGQTIVIDGGLSIVSPMERLAEPSRPG